MANLFFGNESDLIIDAMRLSGSVVNDADMEAHFFLPDTVRAITNATNATPIVVTAAAHGLNNGDEVVIAHVLGNTAANGRWIVANKTTDTFELTDSVGNGAYIRGGHCYDAVENGTELPLEYQVGSNGKYVALIPATINLQSGEDCRVIVLCSNYAFQIEGDHTMRLRTA